MPEQLHLFGDTVKYQRHSLLRPLGATPVVIVELDADGLRTDRVLENAEILRSEGVHAISIADNPGANARVDSFQLANLIQGRVGITAIPHLTCRDRNLLGLTSTLMGGTVSGLRNVLALTGDALRKSAFRKSNRKLSANLDVNSHGLISMIRAMNQGRNILEEDLGGRSDYLIGTAIRTEDVAHFDAEAERLQEKVKCGADFAMSQIFFLPQTVEALYAATRRLAIPIFAGLMPLFSLRNARFVNDNMFKVPESILARMTAVADDKAAVRAEGVSVCKELVPVILRSGAPGFYLVCPFGRIELILEILSCIRSNMPQWSHSAYGSQISGDAATVSAA